MQGDILRNTGLTSWLAPVWEELPGDIACYYWVLMLSNDSKLSCMTLENWLSTPTTKALA